MKTRTKLIIGALILLVAGGAVAALMLLRSGPELLQPGDLTDDEETKKLAKGELILLELKSAQPKGVAAQAKKVIEAPVDKVWPVVRDCQHFSKFMPRIVKSELRKREGDVLTCYVEIKMPFPFSNLKAETRSTIERLPNGSFKRSWTLIEGSFKHMDGSYEVSPFKGDPDRALVVYTVDVRPSLPIPDSILKGGQRKSLPKVFLKIAERAQR